MNIMIQNIIIHQGRFVYKGKLFNRVIFTLYGKECLQEILILCSKNEKSMLLFIHNFSQGEDYEAKNRQSGYHVFLSGG